MSETIAILFSQFLNINSFSLHKNAFFLHIIKFTPTVGPSITCTCTNTDNFLLQWYNDDTYCVNPSLQNLKIINACYNYNENTSFKMMTQHYVSIHHSREKKSHLLKQNNLYLKIINACYN